MRRQHYDGNDDDKNKNNEEEDNDEHGRDDDDDDVGDNSLQPVQRLRPVVREQGYPVLDLLQRVAVHHEYSRVFAQLLHSRLEHVMRRVCAHTDDRKA